MKEENQLFLNRDNNKNINEVIKIKSDDIIYICGKRRVGKSYLMEYLGKGFERYIVYDGATHQHSNMGEVVRTPEELKITLEKGINKIVCQPLKDNSDVFNEFCEVIWKTGNIVLMVEELGNYSDNYSSSEFFDMIVRVGRNRGIGIIAINQRPARIWNNFVSLIDHWFIFQSDLPRDIKFLSEYIGEKRAESLKNIQKRFFYYKNEEGVFLCNPI